MWSASSEIHHVFKVSVQDKNNGTLWLCLVKNVAREGGSWVVAGGGAGTSDQRKDPFG